MSDPADTTLKALVKLKRAARAYATEPTVTNRWGLEDAAKAFAAAKEKEKEDAH